MKRVAGLFASVAVIALVGLLLAQSRPAPQVEAGARGATPSPLSTGPTASDLDSPTERPSPIATGRMRHETIPPMAQGIRCGTYIDSPAMLSFYFDLKFLARESNAVVAGTVVEIGDGHWATVDGKPPVEEGRQNPRPSWFEVYRVIQVDLTGVGKRPRDNERFEAGSSIEVRMLGGNIGCLTFRNSMTHEVEDGPEVVLFLGEQLVPQADLDVISAYPVVDGKVHGHDLTLTVDELLELSLRPR